MTDQEIISGIKTGSSKASLEAIYRQFPIIRKMILSKGGNEEEAKDIFQESIIVFYRMCLKSDFQLSSAISTLIFAICHKMWLKKVRDHYSKEQKLSAEHLSSLESETVENAEEEIQKLKVMENVLNEIGNPCKDLLINFYYRRISMKEIATIMGYSGEKTAKAQKYKCLERAKKMVSSFRFTLTENEG